MQKEDGRFGRLRSGHGRWLGKRLPQMSQQTAGDLANSIASLLAQKQTEQQLLANYHESSGLIHRGSK